MKFKYIDELEKGKLIYLGLIMSIIAAYLLPEFAVKSVKGTVDWLWAIFMFIAFAYSISLAFWINFDYVYSSHYKLFSLEKRWIRFSKLFGIVFGIYIFFIEVYIHRFFEAPVKYFLIFIVSTYFILWFLDFLVYKNKLD